MCELVCNESHYLKPDISWRVVDDSDCALAQLDLLRETFIQDCIETTKAGTYCNMWHIYALSSVLKFPIRSIYPEHNQYIRPQMHKTVTPQGNQDLLQLAKTMLLLCGHGQLTQQKINSGLQITLSPAYLQHQPHQLLHSFCKELKKCLPIIRNLQLHQFPPCYFCKATNRNQFEHERTPTPLDVCFTVLVLLRQALSRIQMQNTTLLHRRLTASHV